MGYNLKEWQKWHHDGNHVEKRVTAKCEAAGIKGWDFVMVQVFKTLRGSLWKKLLKRKTLLPRHPLFSNSLNCQTLPCKGLQTWSFWYFRAHDINIFLFFFLVMWSRDLQRAYFRFAKISENVLCQSELSHFNFYVNSPDWLQSSIMTA